MGVVTKIQNFSKFAWYHESFMMKLIGPNQMLCCVQGMSLHVGYRRFMQVEGRKEGRLHHSSRLGLIG